jgi:hypothetical protein
MTTFVRSHSLDPTVKHGDTSYSTASYPPARLATPRDDLHHFVTAAEGSRRLRVRVERLTVQEPTASSIGKSWPGPEAGLIEHACRHYGSLCWPTAQTRVNSATCTQLPLLPDVCT